LVSAFRRCRGSALAHGGTVATTAPPRRRGPGPRPSISFSYKLRRNVPTNIPSSPSLDNLVSRVSGSTSGAHNMSLASAVGDGTGIAAKEGEKELTMTDVARQLQAIEDMMQPLVPMRDQVAAIETTLAEQGQ
jgi:hypothetical protein